MKSCSATMRMGCLLLLWCGLLAGCAVHPATTVYGVQIQQINATAPVLAPPTQ